MRLDERASRPWLLRAFAAAGVAVVLGYVVMWMLGRYLGPIRELGESVECRRNMHMLARAFNLYADDYESMYAPASQWETAIAPYVEPRYRRCPAWKDLQKDTWGYAMNRQVSAKSRDHIDRLEQTPVVFDSDTSQHNAAGSPSELPRPGRHVTRSRAKSGYARGNWIGYADGSARVKLDNPSPRSSSSDIGG